LLGSRICGLRALRRGVSLHRHILLCYVLFARITAPKTGAPYKERACSVLVVAPAVTGQVCVAVKKVSRL
jgi:hypothetical protein